MNKLTAKQSRILGSNLLSLTAKAPTRSLSTIGFAVSNNLPGWIELTDAQKESIVGNSYRLFGWRDNLFTLILAAQIVRDTNGDGMLSEDEVQSTRKAIAYIWRDPVTGKCACIFYGLSDTLQSSIGTGQTWGTRLNAFRP